MWYYWFILHSFVYGYSPAILHTLFLVFPYPVWGTSTKKFVNSFSSVADSNGLGPSLSPWDTFPEILSCNGCRYIMILSSSWNRSIFIYYSFHSCLHILISPLFPQFSAFLIVHGWRCWSCSGPLPPSFSLAAKVEDLISFLFLRETVSEYKILLFSSAPGKHLTIVTPISYTKLT